MKKAAVKKGGFLALRWFGQTLYSPIFVASQKNYIHERTG